LEQFFGVHPGGLAVRVPGKHARELDHPRFTRDRRGARNGTPAALSFAHGHLRTCKGGHLGKVGNRNHLVTPT
jgi:hypothetical protein